MRLSLAATSDDEADNETSNAGFMNPHSEPRHTVVATRWFNWSINPPRTDERQTVPMLPVRPQNLLPGKIGFDSPRIYISHPA